MRKINLWNATEHPPAFKFKKTKATIQYITDMYPDETWNNVRIAKFEERRERALEQITANDMLEVIGFNPLGADKILSEG